MQGALGEDEPGQQSPGTGQELAARGGQQGLMPPGLRILNLSSNTISDVGWGLLGQSPALEVLEFSANQLRYVPPPLLACSYATQTLASPVFVCAVSHANPGLIPTFTAGQ